MHEFLYLILYTPFNCMCGKHSEMWGDQPKVTQQGPRTLGLLIPNSLGDLKGCLLFSLVWWVGWIRPVVLNLWELMKTMSCNPREMHICTERMTHNSMGSRTPVKQPPSSLITKAPPVLAVPAWSMIHPLTSVLWSDTILPFVCQSLNLTSLSLPGWQEFLPAVRPH